MPIIPYTPPYVEFAGVFFDFSGAWLDCYNQQDISGGGGRGPTGPTGPTGPEGPTGPTGPEGPTGPFNTNLANRVIVNSVGAPSVTPLSWYPAAPPDQYVPLVADNSITFVPPTAPIVGLSGWRFRKTYALIPVSLATPNLVSGSTYTIVAPGTVNWTAIGASASTAGTQFKYNGVTITGASGTATENSKISWYQRNSLYGLTLPVTTPPLDAVSKASFRNIWFLVKFNADIALQGSLAIQIDTYAYQFTFPGPTYPAFTGRWAYSFPLQQGFGFSAVPTTNITTSIATPRLRAGFTYLLYAGDYSTVGCPGPIYTGTTSYLAGGAGLFAPSQSLVENTLKDPYDIYPEYPHIGLTSSIYTANATQPPFGSGSYSDPAAVEVASIYLNTSSTSPSSGTGQTVTDFEVIDMGFTTSSKSQTYPLSWV